MNTLVVEPTFWEPPIWTNIRQRVNLGEHKPDLKSPVYPSKIEWDLTNGPLSKLLELLDTQV